MWMTTIKKNAARLDQVDVTLVLTGPAELDALAGLLGAKIEIKRVPQTGSELASEEEPK